MVLDHKGFRKREILMSLITSNIAYNFITWGLSNFNTLTKGKITNNNCFSVFSFTIIKKKYLNDIYKTMVFIHKVINVKNCFC